MTEREKMIEIVLDTEITGIKLRNITGGMSTANAIADALIAANIGDVTEHKEIIRDLNTDVVAYRALCKADDLEQIIEGQKSLIDEYKHRVEVAEERLKKLKKTEGDLTVEEEISILENLFEEAKHRSFVFERELVKYKIAFDKAIKLAYKLRTELDELSCSSCEFGYAIDTCKKIGLYDDCENRWKEELLQQAGREVEEEKK